MKNLVRLFILATLAASCSLDFGSLQGGFPDSGTGGAGGQAGTSALTGGTTGSGGMAGAGGKVSTGGAVGTGGNPGKGGTTSVGGTITAGGGATSTGGSTTTGGTTGSGGNSQGGLLGGTCVLNSDCSSPLVCTWGKCHVSCHTSADCPAEQSCIISSGSGALLTVCQLPVETYCAYNSDCPIPLTCAADLRCRNQCQTSADCSLRQTCTTTKTCAEPSQVDSNNNLIKPDGGATSGGLGGRVGGDAGVRDAPVAQPDVALGGTGGSTGGTTTSGGTTSAGGTTKTGGTTASGGASGSGGTSLYGGTPPSCSGLAATCGPSGNESCCTSLLVPGGTFYRSYDGVTYTDKSYPATVADFYLDKYEITVGRFRQFVNKGMGTQTSPPSAGDGVHPGITGSGWDSTWKTNLAANTASLTAAMKCDSTYQTWTDAVGSNENKPMNCLDWYTAFAFCAWDGGRLPTEAEWNYAASGGNEQRYYPWSSPPTSTTISDSYAVYNCDGPCIPLNVGSKSPTGDGKWGQTDLAGNVWEWTLDWYDTYQMPCNNCADITDASAFYRVLRGGDFDRDASYLRSAYREVYDFLPWYNDVSIGARCARANL